MHIFRATAEYPATIVFDSTHAQIFKEREMRMNELTQVAGYSAVKPYIQTETRIFWFWLLILSRVSGIRLLLTENTGSGDKIRDDTEA